jgi:hypothetical protein
MEGMEHLPLGPPITIKPIVLRSIVVFLASLILIPTLLLILRPGTADAWFDDSYAYRQKITFTHNANLTNASMRLTVSNTDTLVTDGKMQGDCDDTRFTDSNGKVLRFKLVSGCNSASTVYDVLFPTVLNGSNLAFFYYGNPSAVSASDSSVPDGTVPSGTPSFGSEEKGPSPALYLRFDEGYGATAQDTTSNNNDAAISGAAWKTKELCLFENCLFFDGTDDVVTVTNADSIDMDQALAAGMTYQAWVRVNSDGEGSVGEIFNKGTNTYLRISNEGADGMGDVEASLALATSNATATITDGIQLNTWTHIAVAYTDDADDEITVYINGVQKGASTNGSGAPAADSNNLLIGGPTTANFHGFLDEFKVYPVERTSEQIKTDTTKATSLHGTAASFGDDQSFISEGLVGYWKLDESSGNAADSSGNANTLTNNDSTNYTAGKFGNAGWFDAASSDYFSTATTINNINTVSFWASPSATTDEFINLTASARITASSGTVSFTGVTNPSVYVNGVLNGTITADTWNHIVAVTTTPMNADIFEIGRANSAYANGKIDDVRLYNRTLSASDVSRLHDWGPAPIAHWTFDERQGATANDISGNANTGTLTNGPKWTTGKFGQALEFDGVDDYFDTPQISLTTSFTMSAWVWQNVTGIQNTIFGNTQNDSILEFDSGDDIGFGSDGGAHVQWQNVVPPENEWHHITVVFRVGTTDTAETFIDGVSQGVQAFGADPDFATNSNNRFTWIGREVNGGFFNGKIDDARVYNYALTPKQIVSIMNADHPSVGSPVGSAIAHYKFDEGFGTVANNSGSAGSVLNGTLTGMDSPATYGSGWTNHGKFGKALNFDAVNDYVNAGSDTSLDDITQLTFSAWINPRSWGEGNFGRIFDKSDGTSLGRLLFLCNTSSNCQAGISHSIAFQQYTSGTDGKWLAPTDSIKLNEWQHVAVFYDRSSAANDPRIYINGSEVAVTENFSISGSIETDAAQDLFIGNGADTSRTFDGTIDDIRIYNYELSPDEIKVLYNQGQAQVLGSLSTDPDGITASNSAARAYCPPGDTAPCNPPIAHWNFDERLGTTANDITGNGNTGTLTNGPKPAIGILGQALDFDAVDDLVSVNASASLNDLFSANGGTLSAWVNPRSMGESDFSSIIGKDDAGPSNEGWKLSFGDSGGGTNRVIFTQDYSTTGLQRRSVDNALNLNEWQYLVVTWDGTNNASNVHIYRNGIEVLYSSTINGVGTFGSDALEPLSIGNFRAGTLTFDGLIDDVRIYNYALTPAQIRTVYNQNSAVRFGPLTGSP